MLIGWIESNLTNMFTDVNEKVGTIAAEWANTVRLERRRVPDDPTIRKRDSPHRWYHHHLRFVLRADFHDHREKQPSRHGHLDVLQVVFKAAVAIYLVTHTFDIVMAVFDIGQNVVSGAAGVIHGNTSIDIDSTIAQMRTGMENMGVGELLGLSIETLLISLCLKIMAILITVILYGRMIEIYCTVSIAPIPIATMSNREWGSIGTNYLKGLFALAFQGFHHGLRRHLCSADQRHDHRRQHSFGSVLCGGVHGHSVFLAVQDRKPRKIHFPCALRRSAA